MCTVGSTIPHTVQPSPYHSYHSISSHAHTLTHTHAFLPPHLPHFLTATAHLSLSLPTSPPGREDFKIILREVRRSNNNTLSGLSLDSIADQVRSIIEARERGDAGSKVKPRPLLPPVAQAPPPINSSTEYTEEWSCVICYEDMDSTDSSRLMCGHRFHTEVGVAIQLSLT